MILKISLRPRDKFFFGSEGSFKEDGNDESRRSTYLLHSRYFPQQTGVLGLLRNQLLLQSGLLASNDSRMTAENRQKAKVLIGAQNFVRGKTDDFGVIQKISPIFLLGKDSTICPPAPLDDRKIPDPEDDSNAHPIEFELDSIGDQTWPRLKNYREKEGLFAQIQHPAKGNTALKCLFLEKERVGITKAAKPWGNEVSGKDDEEGYYYQTYLQFFPQKEEINKTLQEKKPPFLTEGYVFYAEIQEQIKDEKSDIAFSWTDGPINAGGFTLGEGLVEFGGERSVFHMQVEKMPADAPFPSFVTSYRYAKLAADLQNKVKRLVCLSPAYVNDMGVLRKNSYLVVSETISFRFLSTSVEDTKHYQNIKRNGNATTMEAPLESKLFHLLDRGSVVYFSSQQEPAIKTLFDQNDFQKIGYNQYHIL